VKRDAVESFTEEKGKGGMQKLLRSVKVEESYNC